MPTLIEWDTDIPPLDVLLHEAETARTVLAESRPRPWHEQRRAPARDSCASSSCCARCGSAAPTPSLNLWLRESGERAGHALAAYRGNASAIAERALASAFPTVQQLLGDESFALLARALWHHAPPQRGDLACWGDALPGWIERDAQLADEPYLADVARVDWAVHTIEQAADVEPPAAGLALLAEHDPMAACGCACGPAWRW